MRPSGRRGGALHARVCGHRGVRGDSGTAGRHGPSLPLLSGQLSPGRGPTEPQAFICRGLRQETPAGSPDTVGVCGLQSVSHAQPGPPTALHGAGCSGGRRVLAEATGSGVRATFPPQDTQDGGRSSQAEATCLCLDEGTLDSWEQDPRNSSWHPHPPQCPYHRKARRD